MTMTMARDQYGKGTASAAPGALEAAAAFLSAARNTDSQVRALYCACARVEVDRVEAELASLKLNLQAIESTLGQGEQGERAAVVAEGIHP